MKMSLTALLDEYLDHAAAIGFSPCTRRQAYYDVRACLRWLGERFGIDMPEKLRPRHLQAWQKHLAARKTGKGRCLKPRSINKITEDMRGYLRHLARNGYVADNLHEALLPVKVPHLLPGSVLAHEQMRKLLNNIGTDTSEGYRNRAMLELLYSSGLRSAELLGLDSGDMDFANRTALIMGKGRKQRVVPVGATALKFIENYLKAVRPYLVNRAEEKALFVDQAGKRMPYATLRRIVKAIAAGAGLETNVTPHTFRRSCTTEMLRSGAGMYHIKELLGHESLETLKHYARLTITDLKKTHKKCHPRERDT